MTTFQMTGNERARIRMLSDRLLFIRDETSRDDLREHLRSEIHTARRLRRHESVTAVETELEA